MHKLYQSLSVACLFFLTESYAQQKALKVETKTGTLELPAPNEAASTNKFSNVIGWPKDKMPLAPQGFKVEIFANGIKSPRNLFQLSMAMCWLASPTLKDLLQMPKKTENQEK